jgi:gliding motility-associated-like protein
MRTLPLLMILLLSTLTTFGQKEGNIWYFGYFGGIDFNKGTPPEVLTDGKIYTNEGCATVCDRFGRLLFYTDGSTVLNRLHRQMPNGYGLLGNSTSTQSAVIVPVPGDTLRYYIFTVDFQGSEFGLRYSIVNMKLNGGNGDVEDSAKNILLKAPTCEKIAAISINKQSEYWLVTQGVNGNAWYAWKITKDSINTTPVISNSGIKISSGASAIGYLKFNQQGTRLATCYYNDTCVAVFDFDPLTGKISNAKTIPSGRPYGCEFSASGQYLYVGDLLNSHVTQYDVSGATEKDIQASAYLIQRENAAVGALQMGPDGYIYISLLARGLSAIRYPDKKHEDAEYLKDYVKTKTPAYGLPTMVTNLYKCPQIYVGRDTTLCQGERYVLKYYIKAAKYTWQDGSTADSFTVTKAGTYSVVCKFDDCVTYDTVTVKYAEPPASAFGSGDTTICTGETFRITISEPDVFLTWSNGSHEQTFETSSEGSIWLRQRRNHCDRTDTLKIRFAKPVELNLRDTMLCKGAGYKIKLGNQYPVRWMDESTSTERWITDSGDYHVEIGTLCGKVEGSFNVGIYPDEPLHIPADTLLCDGNGGRIIAGGNDPWTYYSWSDSSHLNYLDISREGTYNVKKTGPCGQYSATVNVRTAICTCPAWYPNVFTPNGDNLNEVWKPVICPVSAYHLRIYNRWGELVWESHDQQQGWDGQFQGGKSQEGMFVYYVSYQTPWREVINSKGSFYLTR